MHRYSGAYVSAVVDLVIDSVAIARIARVRLRIFISFWWAPLAVLVTESARSSCNYDLKYTVTAAGDNKNIFSRRMRGARGCVKPAGRANARPMVTVCVS